jgi:hypothetical protein
MTVSRRLVPGQTHFVTRRARARCAFLLPTPEVKAIVLYALGRAQEFAPGVLLHALTLEVTHTHAALTDAKGESLLPVFLRELHALSARALNAHYGRGENLWRCESYDNVVFASYCCSSRGFHGLRGSHDFRRPSASAEAVSLRSAAGSRVIQ